MRRRIETSCFLGRRRRRTCVCTPTCFRAERLVFAFPNYKIEQLLTGNSTLAVVKFIVMHVSPYGWFWVRRCAGALMSLTDWPGPRSAWTLCARRRHSSAVFWRHPVLRQKHQLNDRKRFKPKNYATKHTSTRTILNIQNWQLRYYKKKCSTIIFL